MSYNVTVFARIDIFRGDFCGHCIYGRESVTPFLRVGICMCFYEGLRVTKDGYLMAIVAAYASGCIGPVGTFELYAFFFVIGGKCAYVARGSCRAVH